MSPSTRRHYTIFTLFMVILGLLAGTAYRTNVNPPLATGVGDRREELIALVKSLEARKSDLVGDLSSLRREASEVGKRASARRGLYEGYTAQVDRMSLLAGLVPMRGPGVVVELGDNRDPPQDAADPNNFIVHDYDLRAVVNALWAGGAEAIAINDQRLVASSAIRCVGTTVLVNNTRLGSPFVIQAIGDREALEASLAVDPAASRLLTQYVRLFGLDLSVETEDQVTLPEYGGTLSPQELQLTARPG